jgi:hypothetical protein
MMKSIAFFVDLQAMVLVYEAHTVIISMVQEQISVYFAEVQV